MRVIPANAQHVGARQEQQDAFGFTDIDDTTFVAHGGVLAVVADGMGGLELGRQASQCAVQTILTSYAAKSPQTSIVDALFHALHLANAAVLQLAENAGVSGNVGTTVVAAVIHQNALYWISVGDSRLYLYQDETLTQLSHDHSFAVEISRAVERGDLSEEEAARHPERHSLTSYIGLPALEVIDVSPAPLRLQDGDRVLLCSDGLYGTLSENDIAAALEGNPDQVAESLIGKALEQQRDHQDNVTAVVMSWKAEGDTSQVRLGVTRSVKPMSLPTILSLACLAALLLGFTLGYWQAKHSFAQGSECRSATGTNSPVSAVPSVGTGAGQ